MEGPNAIAYYRIAIIAAVKSFKAQTHLILAVTMVT
jgi:hypothetical protein